MKVVLCFAFLCVGIVPAFKREDTKDLLRLLQRVEAAQYDKAYRGDPDMSDPGMSNPGGMSNRGGDVMKPKKSTPQEKAMPIVYCPFINKLLRNFFGRIPRLETRIDEADFEVKDFRPAIDRAAMLCKDTGDIELVTTLFVQNFIETVVQKRSRCTATMFQTSIITAVFKITEVGLGDEDRELLKELTLDLESAEIKEPEEAKTLFVARLHRLVLSDFMYMMIGQFRDLLQGATFIVEKLRRTIADSTDIEDKLETFIKTQMTDFPMIFKCAPRDAIMAHLKEAVFDLGESKGLVDTGYAIEEIEKFFPSLISHPVFDKLEEKVAKYINIVHKEVQTYVESLNREHYKDAVDKITGYLDKEDIDVVKELIEKMYGENGIERGIYPDQGLAGAEGSSSLRQRPFESEKRQLAAPPRRISSMIANGIKSTYEALELIKTADNVEGIGKPIEVIVGPIVEGMTHWLTVRKAMSEDPNYSPASDRYAQLYTPLEALLKQVEGYMDEADNVQSESFEKMKELIKAEIDGFLASEKQLLRIAKEAENQNPNMP